MRNCVKGSKSCSTAGSRYDYKCCLHSAAAHLLLKHWCWEVYGARCEKGELCPGWSSRGKQSIWPAFSPRVESWDPTLGAAAVGADRTQSCVAPSTNTAFYWLYRKGTQNANAYRYFTCQLYQKPQISGCLWMQQKLILSSRQCLHHHFGLCSTPRASSQFLHN